MINYISLILALMVGLCSSYSCPFPLPGVDSLGVGFDLVHGKMKLPVVSLNCKDGNKLNNPFNGIEYDVADESSVTISSQSDAAVYVFSTVAQYVATLQEWVGLSGLYSNNNDAAFAYSTEVSKANAVFVGGEFILAVAKNTFQLYEVALAPADQMTITKSFNKMLDNMPEEYSSSEYKKIIDYYGTHVTVTIAVGGEANTFTQVSAVTYGGYSNQRIGNLVTQHFSQATNWTGYGSGDLESFSTQNSSIVSAFSFKGGYVQQVSNYGAWVESIKNAPVVINKRIIDISEFVTHPTKKANLQMAITEHMKTAAKKSITL